MRTMTTAGLRTWFGSICLFATSAVASIAQEPARPAGEKPGAGAATRPSIYDKSADAKVQLAAAITHAKQGDKRILVMFGGDWCGWCRKLHGLFKTNAEVATLLNSEYELVT